MRHGRRLVSIGMPLRNGALYLREALDSLVAQNYRDFELIISDNASADSTPEICREYARQDCRILYHRAAENMGAVWNFNRVLELSRGEYFMWAAADDRRDASYLSRCLACLEREPAAVLCYSTTWLIRNGRLPEECAGHMCVDQRTARERFRSLLQARYNWSTAIYGLIRRPALRRTTAFQNYYGSDRGLLLQLSLQGPFIPCKSAAFYYRVPSADADDAAYCKRVVESLHPQNRARTISLPYWGLGLRYLRIAATARVPARLRVQLMRDVFQYCFFTPSRVMELRRLAGTLSGLRRFKDLLFGHAQP